MCEFFTDFLPAYVMLRQWLEVPSCQDDGKMGCLFLETRSTDGGHIMRGSLFPWGSRDFSIQSLFIDCLSVNNLFVCAVPSQGRTPYMKMNRRKPCWKERWREKNNEVNLIADWRRGYSLTFSETYLRRAKHAVQWFAGRLETVGHECSVETETLPCLPIVKWIVLIGDGE